MSSVPSDYRQYEIQADIFDAIDKQDHMDGMTTCTPLARYTAFMTIGKETIP